MGLKLNAKQLVGMKMLLDDKLKVILFTGGSRTGKTTSIMEWMFMRAMQYPTSRQIVVRSTRQSCVEKCFDDTAKSYLRKFFPSNQYKLKEKEAKIIFPNGSEIHFGGVENGDQLDKILGAEYITVFANEATTFDLDQIGELQGRLAQVRYEDEPDGVPHDPSKKKATCKLVMDCNPRTKQHWLYSWGVLKIDPETKEPLPNLDEREMLHWTPWDNIDHLGEDYIKTLEGLPQKKKDRLLHGLWTNNSGAVFEEFDEEIHVIEPYDIPRGGTIIGGVDFGFKHPFGYLSAYWNQHLDCVDIYYEYKKALQGTKTNAKVVNRHFEQTGLIPDIILSDHQIDSRMEFTEATGLATKVAKKNQRESIEKIQERLVPDEKGRVRLRIFSTCTGLIEEMVNHEYKPETERMDATEAVKKKNDDLIDCLRYIISFIDKVGSASGRTNSF